MRAKLRCARGPFWSGVGRGEASLAESVYGQSGGEGIRNGDKLPQRMALLFDFTFALLSDTGSTIFAYLLIAVIIAVPIFAYDFRNDAQQLTTDQLTRVFHKAYCKA
jgi:hypothetical protein